MSPGHKQMRAANSVTVVYTCDLAMMREVQTRH